METKKVIPLIVLCSSLGYSSITGTVFRDLPFNGESLGTYGVQEDNEPPIKGITVKGVDEYGNEVKTITNENGEYILNGLSGKVRVEFSNWNDYLEESPSEIGKNSIQFVEDGADSVNFALYNPDDYVDKENPPLISSIFTNGKADIENNSSTRDLVSWSYIDHNDDSYNILAYKSQIGSVWGIAHDKNSDNTYVAAFLRRHVGLLDSNQDGYGDVGVIYKIDANNTVTKFFRFSSDKVGTIGDDSKRGLPSDNSPSIDAEAFNKVGNIGLGDIEIAGDGKILYVANLYTKRLYLIDTTKKWVTDELKIPNECADKEDMRPFALKYHDKALYVGVTCVALKSQNQNDLKGIIYRYEQDKFSKILEFPLTYKKGSTFISKGNQFYPWVRDWSELSEVRDGIIAHPQPLLSDIEFIYRKGKKYMVISILDRTGMQTGLKNYNTDGTKLFEGISGGDLLIASINENGKATLESGGEINGTGGLANSQGPDGGEFFYQDDISDDIPNPHKEVALGGMAYLAGSDNIAVNSFDPVRGYSSENLRTAGTRFFYIEDGTYKAGKKLYKRDEPMTLGKAGGIGDLEVIGDLAPIEVGNRIWLDKNGNGIQDPDEKGIAGVKLLIRKNEDDCRALVGTTYTDENGNYKFTNLLPNQNYTICVADSQFKDSKGLPESVLDGLILTKSDIGDDSIDSDAVDKKGIAVIYFNTTSHGKSSYNYDMGFTSENQNSGSIGNFIWYDKNLNGLQDSDEYGIGGIKVQLLDLNGTVISETLTDSKGYYIFKNLEDGNYKIKVIQPKNYPYFTIPNIENNSKDTLDSDIDPKTGVSEIIEIKDGNNYMDLDVGMVCFGCVKLDLQKYTNNEDADSGTGPIILVGEKVVWKYVVKNSGNTKMEGIYIEDDREGNVSCPKDYLEAGEVMECIKEGTAQVGQYENRATVKGITPICDVNATDISHYFGAVPKVDIEKYTNGEDADSGTGPIIPVGEKVIWKYVVRNSGNIKLTDISIIDDKEGLICNKDSLDVNESMVCEKEGTAQAGQYENTATVKAKDIAGNEVNDSDPSHYLGKSGSCIGDFIWEDKNGNGLQDEGENGIAGVEVSLMDSNGNPVKDIYGTTINSQITDDSGKYSFCKLEAGEYIVKITAPDGYQISPKDQGDSDALDSDIDSTTLQSPIITLKDGENRDDIDGGIYKNLCIGNFVWEDINGNGLQDEGENGIAGVEVSLMDSDGNPVKDIYGAEVKSQITGDDGKYLFCNLNAGSYKVKMFKDDPLYFVTYKNMGDESKDSDIDGDTYTTDIINLTSTNLDIDGGFFRCGSPIAVYTVIDGLDEAVDLEGLEVKVYDKNNNLVATGTTDKDGKVEFPNLKAGDYRFEYTTKEGVKFSVVDSISNNVISQDSSAGVSEVVIAPPKATSLDIEKPSESVKSDSASFGATASLLLIAISIFSLKRERA